MMRPCAPIASRMAFPLAVPQPGASDQLSVITGGNEDLTPETSTSYILGVVVNPIRGFTAEMNWYNIKVEGRDPGGRAPRPPCIAASTTMTRSPAPHVSRSAGTGNVTQIQGVLQNIASIRTNGIDLNLAYRTRLANMGDIGPDLEQHVPEQVSTSRRRRRRAPAWSSGPASKRAARRRPSRSGSRSARSIGTASASARH